MLRYFFGFLFFLFLVAAAYYFIGLPPSTIEENKVATQPILLGFVGPLSGDSASYNAHIKNSVELAVRDLKTQGKQIDVIFEDGKCSGDDARAARGARDQHRPVVLEDNSRRHAAQRPFFGLNGVGLHTDQAVDIGR